MNLKLVKLSKEYKEQLFDMMEEWLALEKEFSPHAIRKNDYRNFDFYLEILECREERTGGCRTPCSSAWMQTGTFL